MSRDDIEKLIDNHVISKEAGARILSEFGKKAGDEVGFWFWILPILGALLIVYGMSGLLGASWAALSHISQITALSLTGLATFLLWLYAYRREDKGNILAETTGIIASVVIIFEIVFGMNLYNSAYLVGAREFYILSLAYPVILWIMWSMRSAGATIAYYAYMSSMFFADHGEVWPYALAFILGLLPVGLAYQWYQDGKAVRLMLFNWAFTITGILYIIQYFWTDYLGLCLALVTIVFLGSFVKTNVPSSSFIAWRVFGLPSILINAGLAWEWVQEPHLENMTFMFYIWFIVGIVALALFLKKFEFESCTKIIGYSMLMQLIVIFLLVIYSTYQPDHETIVATVYDVLLGFLGGWMIANGVRKRSLFFINLGVIFVMFFTFLLSMTYKGISNTQMSWILVIEGLLFVIGNIYFSRRDRVDKKEI